MSRVAQFVQEGKFLPYSAGSAGVSAGAVVTIGGIACVADRAIPANGEGAVHAEGVYKFTAGGTISAGQTVTFNASSGKVAAYSSGTTDPKIGTALTPAVSNGGVMVVLNK